MVFINLEYSSFRQILGNIFVANGSVNFYMFFGGTNFGYMNGANILMVSGVEVPPVYVPDVTRWVFRVFYYFNQFLS